MGAYCGGREWCGVRGGPALAPARAAYATRQGLRAARCAALRALQYAEGRAWGALWFRWKFRGEAGTDQGRRVVDRGREARRQGPEYVFVARAPREPLREQRGEFRAGRLGERQRRRGAAERREQDVRAGSRRAALPGRGSCASFGTSPLVNAAHQSSSRAVRENHVRVIQRGLPESARCSRPRRKWPARWRLLRAVRSAHWPYGSVLASVFTEMSAPPGSRSMYAATAASRGGRCAKSCAVRGCWPGAPRFP